MAGYIGANTSSVTNNQNAAERRKKFTFTANTTVLSGLSFLPEKIHIFHNGIRLVRTTDYVEASDGKSVTLVNAAQAGDEVVAVTFDQNPASNAGYTDADVDAHLLTAGVTLDATNDRVGIGTTAPTSALSIEGSSFTDSTIRLKRTASSGTSDDAGLQFTSAAGATSGHGMGGIWFKNSLDDNAYALIRARTDDSTGTSGRLDFITSDAAVGNATASSLTINSSGYITKPNQPAFYMQNTTDSTRWKGGNVRINRGNHWNNTTGTFTAPVAGAYQFGAFGQSNASVFYILAYLNSTSVGAWYDSAGSGYKHASLTIIVNMAANDTFYIGNANINTGGQNGIFGHFLG